MEKREPAANTQEQVKERAPLARAPSDGEVVRALKRLEFLRRHLPSHGTHGEEMYNAFDFIKHVLGRVGESHNAALTDSHNDQRGSIETRAGEMAPAAKPLAGNADGAIPSSRSNSDACDPIDAELWRLGREHGLISDETAQKISFAWGNNLDAAPEMNSPRCYGNVTSTESGIHRVGCPTPAKCGEAERCLQAREPMSFGDLLMDVMTGPPHKKATRRRPQ
jgi:hypothetical protein